MFLEGRKKYLTLTDREILEGLKKGNKDVFEALFRKYVSTLREYAFFYVGDVHIAEDIVQDLFVKIWENRENFNIHTSLKAYLYRSTHNNCIQFLRHKNVSYKHDKYLQGRLAEARLMEQLYFEKGIQQLFEKEITDLVNKSLEKLPTKTSEIFILSRRKYLKNSEIANKLNLSEKSVEYHISKTLELLRTDLKDHLF